MKFLLLFLLLTALDPSCISRALIPQENTQIVQKEEKIPEQQNRLFTSSKGLIIKELMAKLCGPEAQTSDSVRKKAHALLGLSLFFIKNQGTDEDVEKVATKLIAELEKLVILSQQEEEIKI